MTRLVFSQLSDVNELQNEVFSFTLACLVMKLQEDVFSNTLSATTCIYTISSVMDRFMLLQVSRNQIPPQFSRAD